MKMPTPKISYRSQPVTTETLESEDHLIVLSSGDDTALRKFPHGETMLERVHRTSRNLKDGEFVFDLPNRRGTRVALCGIKASASAFDLLTTGRRLAAAMTKDGAERVAVAVAGLDGRSAERAVEAVVAALLAA